MVMCSHESFVSLSGKVFTTSGGRGDRSGWGWGAEGEGLCDAPQRSQEELNCLDESSLPGTLLLSQKKLLGKKVFPV